MSRFQYEEKLYYFFNKRLKIPPSTLDRRLRMFSMPMLGVNVLGSYPNSGGILNLLIIKQ